MDTNTPTTTPRRFACTAAAPRRCSAASHGGLAESLDVDVTLLRIAFVALTVLGGGIGIPLYVAAWIVAPEN